MQRKVKQIIVGVCCPIYVHLCQKDGLHVAVDISYIPSNFLLGNGNVNSNGDDCDQNTSLACITYMGSDLAFFQTLRHISKNWANVIVTHTNDNARTTKCTE